MTKLREVADAIEWQMAQDANHPDDLARAAIEAMRITEDAPTGNAFDNAFAFIKADWNAAIDAALSHEGK